MSSALVPAWGSWELLVGSCWGALLVVVGSSAGGGAVAPPSVFSWGMALTTGLLPSSSPALPVYLLASPTSAACGGLSISGHSSSGMSSTGCHHLHRQTSLSPCLLV